MQPLVGRLIRSGKNVRGFRGQKKLVQNHCESRYSSTMMDKVQTVYDDAYSIERRIARVSTCLDHGNPVAARKSLNDVPRESAYLVYAAGKLLSEYRSQE